MDACVVVKWVLHEEPYEKEAVRLKDDLSFGTVELAAPSLIVEEVGNSLWKAVKIGSLTEKAADEALKALGHTGIDLYELDWTQISQTLRIACQLDLTVYDASYLFLAKKIDAQVVTADDKLCRKSKGHFEVLHVKDYL